MRIAFFSDDGSGSLCGRMVAHALNRLDGPATLATRDGAWTPDPKGAGPTIEVVPRTAGLHALEAAMCPSSHAAGDFVMSMPLDEIGDEALRQRFDVAVAVGGEPAAAARALRAARYDTGDPGRTAPVWFLALAGQSTLMTKARLAPSQGPRLPYGTRALPMMLPRIGPDAARRLLDDAPDDGILATATLLAALLLAVGANPSAQRLDAADLAVLMAARDMPQECALADRLVGLAVAYGRLAGEPVTVEACPAEARSRDRRRPIAGATADRRTSMRPDRICRWG